MSNRQERPRPRKSLGSPKNELALKRMVEIRKEHTMPTTQWDNNNLPPLPKRKQYEAQPAPRESGIFIEDTYGASFKFATIKALDKISSKGKGANLLKVISNRYQGVGTSKGKSVVIHLGQGTLADHDSSMSHTYQNSTVGPGRTEVRRAASPGSVVRLPGSGMSSTVYYNPNIEHQYTMAAKIKTPAYIALAHELIHAMHSLGGEVLKPYSWANGTPNSSSGAILEEAKTVGLGIYKNTAISENAIRREHNLPQRTFYAVAGDCDSLKR